MHDLTRGSIYKTFFLFALPMVLAGILSQMHHLVNTVIAGRLIGEAGLAAIGATSPLITVISAIFWGYGSGFAIYIARLFGEGKFSRIKNAVCTNYLVVSIVIMVMSAFLIVFYEQIFDLLKIDEAIRKEAFDYFSVYIAGLFIINLSTNGLYIINALGMSAFPLYMSIVTMVLNIGGNVIAVKYLGFGVEGIAFSSVLAAFVVTVCYVVRIGFCFKEMKSDERIRLDFSIFSESLGYYLPSTLQQSFMYIASVTVSPLINGIDASAAAAYAVVLKIYDFDASVYQNSAKTLSNYTAQCMGARKYDKVKKGINVGLVQGLMFFVPVLLLTVIFARSIVSIFYPSGFSGDAFDYTLMFVRIYMPFLMFNMVNNLFHALCRGLKKMGLLMVSTAVGTVVRIAVSMLLVGKYGMHGIYIGWAASWIAEAVFVAIVYFTGKWKPSELKDEKTA